MKKDKIIVCQDCQSEFAWTEGEQEFYKSKDLEEPIRCPVCRAMLKAAKEDRFRGKAEGLGKD